MSAVENVGMVFGGMPPAVLCARVSRQPQKPTAASAEINAIDIFIFIFSRLFEFYKVTRAFVSALLQLDTSIVST
jgi:hypothetical protein